MGVCLRSLAVSPSGPLVGPPRRLGLIRHIGFKRARVRFPGASSLNESTNWAGQIDTGTTYTDISGEWTVPTVQPSADSEYSATWIGIDGAENSDLIQTGTDQFASGGSTTYAAWYEILPAAEVIISEPVDPGDDMDAAITRGVPGNLGDRDRRCNPGLAGIWTVQLFGAGRLGGVDRGSADRQRRPIDSGELRCRCVRSLMIGGADLRSSDISPVYMVNTADTIIAYPSLFDADADSFAVFYGSPTPPVVTSISPSTVQVQAVRASRSMARDS